MSHTFPVCYHFSSRVWKTWRNYMWVCKCVYFLWYVYYIVFDNWSLHIHYVVLHCIIIIQGKAHLVISDIVFFHGARNVQHGGAIISARHLIITFGHGDEHVFSLLLSDICQHITAYKMLARFTKRLLYLFGSTRYVTTAMFKMYPNKENRILKYVLIKPSDFRYIFFCLTPQLNFFIIFMNVLYCNHFYHIVRQDIIFLF